MCTGHPSFGMSYSLAQYLLFPFFFGTWSINKSLDLEGLKKNYILHPKGETYISLRRYDLDQKHFAGHYSTPQKRKGRLWQYLIFVQMLNC